MSRRDFEAKLKKRVEQSYDDRNRGGGRLNLLELSGHEINFWSPKEGKPKDNGRNHIVIIPYEIAIENMVLHGDLKKGDPDFKLDVWHHKTGKDNKIRVVCPRTTLGEEHPCPICEEIEANKDLWAVLKPIRNPYYFILDLDDPKEEIKLWQVPHYYFEKHVLEENDARVADGKNRLDVFSLGVKILFTSKKTNRGYDYGAFGLEKLDKPLDFSLIDDTFALDSCMNILSYNRIRAMHLDIPENDIDENQDETQDDSEQADSTEKEEKKEEKKASRRTGRRAVKETEEEPEYECIGAKFGGVFGETCLNLPELENDADDYPCESCEDEIYDKCLDLTNKRKKK